MVDGNHDDTGYTAELSENEEKISRHSRSLPHFTMEDAGRLRIILIVLSLMTLLSAVSGGFFYFYSFKKQAVDEIHTLADSRITLTAKHLSKHIYEREEAAANLASNDTFEDALRSPTDANRAEAERLLDVERVAMGVDLAYLLDRKGTVIASSGRANPENMEGKNYDVGPSFKRALQGTSSVNLVRGMTTGNRGIYFGSPVHDKSSGKVLGVAVIKGTIELLEPELISLEHQGHMVLLSPEGIVFASDQKSWLYRSLWKPPPESAPNLRRPGQSDTHLPRWTGLQRTDDQTARDHDGTSYLIHKKAIAALPGWQLVYLHNLRLVAQGITLPFFNAAAQIGAAWATLICLATYILYKLAAKDIRRRHEVEKQKEQLIEKLQTALDEIKILEGILPICAICKKIRDDAGAWHQLEAYISSKSEVKFSHGLCPTCLRNHYGIRENDG